MSKRTDKVIARITASLDEKIKKWESKIDEYQDYQDTFGGYKYLDQIEEYTADVKTLRNYRTALQTVKDQRDTIDALEVRTRELKALLRKAADKMTGYGEFEVLIRQINQEVNR